MARYAAMISMNMDTAGAVWVMVWATPVSSAYPMATPRLLFLVRLRHWLIQGGMMTRRAWGKMINRSVLIPEKPDSPGRFGICPRSDRLDAGADDFGDEGRSVQHQPDEQHQQSRLGGEPAPDPSETPLGFRDADGERRLSKPGADDQPGHDAGQYGDTEYPAITRDMKPGR